MTVQVLGVFIQCKCESTWKGLFEGNKCTNASELFAMIVRVA